MFAPSQIEVRRFFCSTYAKWRDRLPLTPMETLAAQWIEQHPEYHAELADIDEALRLMQQPSETRENPFLHLSMHLAIEEQLSIDQPPGIRAAFEAACQHRGDRHDAMHDALECLGEMLFDAQRKGTPPDGAAYVGALRKRAGLARALALDPPLLFLDEPTAGLDPIGAAAFDQLILTLRDALGLTVFIVTHDLDTIYTITDRVAVLAQKKVLVNAGLDEVAATDDAWIREYFHGPRGRAAATAVAAAQAVPAASENN